MATACAHAEMSFGPGVIMLGSAKPDKGWVSAKDLPAVNQTIYVVVDDPDATTPGPRRLEPRNYWGFGTYRPGSDWK